MDDSQLLRHSKTWDRTGVFVAGLCLIHCLAFPFLIAAIPALHAFFDNSYLEITILTLGIVVGSISFFTSYRRHRKIYPMLIGALGVAFLLTNLFVIPMTEGVAHSLSEHSHSALNIHPLMILGGLFLIAGHIWNIHACHCFCDKSCHHEEHQQ